MTDSWTYEQVLKLVTMGASNRSEYDIWREYLKREDDIGEYVLSNATHPYREVIEQRDMGEARLLSQHTIRLKSCQIPGL